MKKFFLFALCAFVSTIAIADDGDKEFNAIKFTYNLFLLNDFELDMKLAKENGFVCDKENIKRRYSAQRSIGAKESLALERMSKNGKELCGIRINVNKWKDADIIKTLNDLGFTESRKDNSAFLSTPVTSRFYLSKDGYQEIEFKTYWTANTEKEIRFRWTSTERSRGAAPSPVQSSATDQNSQITQQSVGVVPIEPVGTIPQVNEKKFKVKNVEFSMRFVPHGTFVMGKGNNTLKVELTQDYWVSETEVTTGLYDAVMDTKLVKNHPQWAKTATWLGAMEFLRRLNIITGYNFRLITEAEWEYAARYGNGTKRFSGSDRLDDVWIRDVWNVKDPRPDYPNKPNYLGIYGMSNSVAEWCYDIYQEKFPSQPQRDYAGPSESEMKGKEHQKVIRGGASETTKRISEEPFEVTARGSEFDGLMPHGIRLALYDNDVKNRVVQDPVDERKVNLPAGMPVRWRGAPYTSSTGYPRDAVKSYMMIKNVRHRLVELSGHGDKVGYGYVYLGQSKDQGYYIIEKIVMKGKNTFTMTIIPTKGGQTQTMTLTYKYYTSTWKKMSCQSSIPTFNGVAFAYDSMLE